MKIGTMTEPDWRTLSHCLFVVSESFERVKKGISQEDFMEKIGTFTKSFEGVHQKKLAGRSSSCLCTLRRQK